MRIYWFLAAVAAVVLGGASIWMGGLNQDEGWYLYAANLVADGKLPYRDFFYTQGPLLPIVYSAFTFVWKTWGLLGARLFNLAVGFLGIVFACALAARLTSRETRRQAALVAFFLLATNLYHLYYLAIPKTYALAALFVAVGFYLLTFALEDSVRRWKAVLFPVASGLCLAFAAGTRISLGAILAVVGFGLLVGAIRKSVPRFAWLWFGIGGAIGLALVYGPILADDSARAGLLAAQRYHAARGGSDIVWTVGSFSRLVRWYLPAFIVLGLGVGSLLTGAKDKGHETRDVRLLLLSFLAVFVVQMLAPFPYEDYQVPIMGLLSVYAAVTFIKNDLRPFSTSTSSLHLHLHLNILLVLGLSFANAFGSPLLEKWMTNGQDRFWSLKKEKTELAQLRDVAKRVNALDPDGKTLLTQDLYLAIETNRKVPAGLEMGPFSMLDDAGWRKLLTEASKTCKVAAGSGYMFAIKPPACTERSFDQQLEYWNILKSFYEPAFREESFGQNATPLLVLKRK